MNNVQREQACCRNWGTKVSAGLDNLNTQNKNHEKEYIISQQTTVKLGIESKAVHNILNISFPWQNLACTDISKLPLGIKWGHLDGEDLS